MSRPSFETWATVKPGPIAAAIAIIFALLPIVCMAVAIVGVLLWARRRTGRLTPAPITHRAGSPGTRMSLVARLSSSEVDHDAGERHPGSCLVRGYDGVCRGLQSGLQTERK
jgi:hypothetical protein